MMRFLLLVTSLFLARLRQPKIVPISSIVSSVSKSESNARDDKILSSSLIIVRELDSFVSIEINAVEWTSMY